MTKAQLKKLCSNNGIMECEVEQAIDFVCDLLYARRREIETVYPCATNTIASLVKAEQEVYDLLYHVENELTD